MINFVVENNKNNENLDKIRKLVVTGTTAVLVVYLVTLAGFLGWGAYWSRRESKATASFVQKSAEVDKLAEQEVVIRKLSDRLDAINAFLDSRSNLTTLSATTVGENISVGGWTFEASGKVKVRALGQGVDEIKLFSDNMVQKFSAVSADSITWSPTDGWVGNISVKGLKNVQ
jgi:hypothetical protein